MLFYFHYYIKLFILNDDINIYTVSLNAWPGPQVNFRSVFDHNTIIYFINTNSYKKMFLYSMTLKAYNSY